MGEFVCIMSLVCLYTCVRVCAFVGVCETDRDKSLISL